MIVPDGDPVLAAEMGVRVAQRQLGDALAGWDEVRGARDLERDAGQRCVAATRRLDEALTDLRAAKSAAGRGFDD